MIVIFILFMVVSKFVAAGEVSLIENMPKKNIESAVVANVQGNQKIVKEKTDDADINLKQMEEFINQENDRIKSIKILSLDIERAGLELKKREIETKLSQLTSFADSSLLPNEQFGKHEKKVRIKLLGILLSAESKQAVISIDGVNSYVSEGQKMSHGSIIEKIDADSMTLKSDNGQREKIILGA